jgi:hypothetical protein
MSSAGHSGPELFAASGSELVDAAAEEVEPDNVRFAEVVFPPILKTPCTIPIP